MDSNDPVAKAAVHAIRTGDTTSLASLLSQHPGLASEQIHETRTPLHVVTDWPGYFPAARPPSACSLRQAPTPTWTRAESGPRRRCTGPPAATTPTSPMR